MKCANCSAGAVFTVTHPASRPVHYCNPCLPKHLRERADAGHFPLQAPLPVVTEEPATKKNKKKASDPVEETVEEAAEEVSEEASSEDI